MILVLRALGVGDLVSAVPALRALRAAAAGRPLALAAPAWLGPLVQLTGVVDQHLPVESLAGPPPPVPAGCQAVNLHGRGPQSHRLLRAVHPACLQAFACPEAGHVDGPPWRADEHEVHRWCRMLRWYGIEADPADLALRRPPADRVPAGVSIVHPGAKAPERRWPVYRFATVARFLAAHGHRVVITGSATEAPRAERVAQLAGLSRDAVLAGTTDTGELAALVAHARLLVSGDTGVAHLATAYRTPSVVLFGPVPPRLWGPPPDRPEHCALWHPQPDGREAVPGPPHPALLAIGIAEVLEAALRVSGG